jgi:hypothetical protein
MRSNRAGPRVVTLTMCATSSSPIKKVLERRLVAIVRPEFPPDRIEREVTEEETALTQRHPKCYFVKRQAGQSHAFAQSIRRHRTIVRVPMREPMVVFEKETQSTRPRFWKRSCQCASTPAMKSVMLSTGHVARVPLPPTGYRCPNLYRTQPFPPPPSRISELPADGRAGSP